MTDADNADLNHLPPNELPIFFKELFCPNQEAAMGSILVSLPCTAYLWESLIVLCDNPYATDFLISTIIKLSHR